VLNKFQPTQCYRCPSVSMRYIGMLFSHGTGCGVRVSFVVT
jgi:hypothetical protein